MVASKPIPKNKVKASSLAFLVFLKNLSYKKYLIRIYICIILLGILLTALYATFPTLISCSSLFGDEFCTPTGIFIILLASLPGYLFVGNVLKFLGSYSDTFSIAAVFIFNLIFYRYLGALIDALVQKKYNSKNTSSKIVIVAFVVLVIILIGLLAQT